jgi:hypothetical protein
MSYVTLEAQTMKTPQVNCITTALTLAAVRAAVERGEAKIKRNRLPVNTKIQVTLKRRKKGKESR